MTNNKKGLTREQATELYKDLQRSMAKMLKNESEFLKSNNLEKSNLTNNIASKAYAKNMKMNPGRHSQFGNYVNRISNKGAVSAFVFLLGFTVLKIIMSAIEFSGFAGVQNVEASYTNLAPESRRDSQNLLTGFSKEELQVLTSLDSKRSELENKGKRLDERESDLQKRDKEFTIKLTELRELSDKLKNERDKSEKKSEVQLDQLANVYGSMNPNESAKLIEQLDIVTAVSLVSRMPEKRIAQILSSMTSERALEITGMLSGKSHS